MANLLLQSAPRLSAEDWSLLDEAVDGLEQSWRTTHTGDVTRFVPPAGHAMRGRVLVDLIKVDQEYRWASGQKHLLEAYLADWPELGGTPHVVGELLEAECLTRAAFDRLPAREELHSRFPQIAEEIDLEKIAAEAKNEDAASPPGSSSLYSLAPINGGSLSAAAEAKSEHAASPPESSSPYSLAPIDGEPLSATSAQPASSPDPPLSKGHRLGSYEIIELLGQGAMGAVYLAQDLELPRRVAIKVPHRDRFRSPQEAEHFLEEAGTIARLNHPGIVPIYHLGRDAVGTPFIVMEYVEGVSLEKVLQTERLPPARTAGLMVEIADAVHYAHRRGFVHRDLKPANVLLDKEGRAHVVDFGLAVHESVQRRRAGQYAGTPPYMAPEQVRGETHRLDGRADVWALGVMLYEMLSGGHPFAGENWEDLADEIQNREPKPPRQTSDGDQIPAELERICLRCLCKPVAGRYNTAGDVSRDLRRWLHPRPRFRRPAFVGGLAAAVLLLALGARQLWQRVHEPLPAAAPALSGTIDVLIWNPTDRSRRFLKLHDRGALPLRPNDQIRVEARLNRPAYLYLVWIDSEGRAFPVYPWQPGQWSRRLPKQAPASRLSLPETADQGWPMKGPAGMETLMLLARESPLPADVDLAGLLAGLPKVPLQDPRALVCFADGQMVTRLQDADRGPNFFGAQQIDDPVLKTQRELRDRLGSHFELNRAVTFANQGE